MEYFTIAETWDRDTLERHQIAYLKETALRAAYAPFYASLFQKNRFHPEQIHSLDDLRRIPPTTKDDLRGGYPGGFIAVPEEELVRLHVSSGTTGTPVAVYHTREDLEEWADLMARCMFMVGIRPHDVFQNIAGYGLFTGGLGIHSGAERLGCLTIPAGTGNTRRQIRLMKDFKTTAIHIIPSYALYLANALQEEGYDPRALSLRIALVGAEPHTDAARRRIEELFNVRAYNSYGLSEMNGPGVAFECQEQNGLHIWEDAYLVEILDPDSDDPVPDGEVGELVITTLMRRGMPLLRYRTRDLTRFLPGPCPCGRAHRRLDRIHGRTDDMIILKGVNMYPMQVEKTLMAFPEVADNYLIVLERRGAVENMVVKVEIRPEHFVEDMRALQLLQRRVARALKDELLVTPTVELVEANTLPRTEGKAKRVMDNRGCDGM